MLAHCGFNQDVVTKCLTSESRRGQSEGVTPCTAFSLPHETIPASSLGALSYRIPWHAFYLRAWGRKKKPLLPCYRGRSASFRLSLRSTCQDNNPLSPQSFFPFALSSSSWTLHADLMHWRAVSHTELAFGGQSHCLWALVAYLLASHYSNNALLTDF